MYPSLYKFAETDHRLEAPASSSEYSSPSPVRQDNGRPEEDDLIGPVRSSHRFSAVGASSFEFDSGEALVSQAEVRPPFRSVVEC